MRELTPQLVQLSENTKDFWTYGYVTTLQSPSNEDFLREMMKYKPILIEDLVSHWPAMEKWNFGYLSSQCGGTYSINISPTGLGDAGEFSFHIYLLSSKFHHNLYTMLILLQFFHMFQIKLNNHPFN